MIRIPIRALRGLMFLSACLACMPAAWAVTAGTMEFVLGDVRIRGANGIERKAAKGAVVEVGETVLTGAGGTAQMRMVDNAFLAVRPDTELAISEYSYSGKADGTENALLRLVRGTMRAFTGAITATRKDRFSTVTATATIGIRGSGNVAHYSPGLGTLNHTIEGSHVVSSVNEQGQVVGSVITTPGQTVQVLANQAPARIPTPPFLLQAATSRPTPGGGQAPQGQGQGRRSEGEKPQGQATAQSGQEAADTAATGTADATIGRASAEPDTALASAATATALATASPVESTVTTTSITGTACDPSVSSACVDLNASQGTASSTTSGTTVPLTSVQQTSGTSTLSGVLTQLQVLHNPSFATAPPNGLVAGVWSSKAVTGGFESLAIEPAHSMQPPEMYLLDSLNNLVELKQTGRVEAHGLNYTDTATDTSALSGGAGLSPGRYVRFVGGTPQDTFSLPDGSLYMGRWEGSSIDLYSDVGLTGGTALVESIPLGVRSAHWALAVAAPDKYIPRLTGIVDYSLLASTRPTDSLGNLGTLNSASLKVDFSAQTLRAGVNVSFASRGITIDALTPFVPLEPGGGFRSDSFSAFPPSINGCAGQGCQGYVGVLNGGIGLSDASGAVVSYAFAPNAAASTSNTPFSDLIEGLVAFKSASAPSLGTNPTALGAKGLFAFHAFYPISAAGDIFLGVDRTTPGPSGTGPLPASSFIMSGSNLVRVLGGAWNVFDRGDAIQCLLGAPCLSPATAGADSVSIFSMAGGTVGNAGVSFNASGDRAATGQLESFTDGTGVRLGRYQGGVVHASSTLSGFSDANVLTPLGSNSVMWSMREIPSAIPLTGSARYLPVFGTAPTDAFGNIGKLNYARLDVDFSSQTVNPAVSAGINNQTLTAWGRDVPINANNFGFDVTSSSFVNGTLNPVPPVPLSVSCTGDCPPAPVGDTGGGYGARISGGFAGDGTADAAFFRYTFNTRYNAALPVGSSQTGAAPAGQTANNYVNGMVAFGKGPQIAAPATPGTSVLASYYWFPQPSLFFGSNDSRASANFGSLETVAAFTGPNGNLLSAAEQPQLTLNAHSLTLSGDTSAASTVTTLPNGISFGRYGGVTESQAGPLLFVNGVDDKGIFSNRTVVGSFNWIQGPGIWPVLTSEPITGSATYSVIGASSPTDQNNVTGTLNSATLNINFDRQALDTSLDITMPADRLMPAGRHWTASASNIALQGGGEFDADTSFSASLAHRSLTVALNGDSSNNPQGNISGTLTGPQLNGAIVSYTLGWGPFGSHEHVNGVVGFGSPSFSPSLSTLSPYQIKLGSHGSDGGFDAVTGGRLGGTSGASIVSPDDYLTRTSFSALDPTRVNFDSKGGLTEFDGHGVVVVSGATVSGCTSPGTCSTSEIPTRIGINASGSAASGAVPAMPAIASAPATVAQFGSDPLTGVSWGRYTDGNFAVVDRVSGNPIGSGNAFLGAINHYLIGPVQSGPTTLPLTGTATYTLVGATSPTEFANGALTVGTLNSATLSANFSAKTVDTGINLTTGPRTWTASAAAVPIIGGVAFEASKALSANGALNVGCAGTGCNPSALAGRITGAFFGSTGQAAGIAYSLNTNGTPTAGPTGGGISVGGVAAFRR